MSQKRKDQVIGALIGLVKACESNDPMETTTPVILEGLIAAGGSLDIYEDEQLAALSEKIREEKFKIVPNCRSCASPCGNTSDYNMEELEKRSDEKRKANLDLLYRLHRLAAKMPADADFEEAFPLYQGLAAISFDWEPQELDELAK